MVFDRTKGWDLTIGIKPRRSHHPLETARRLILVQARQVGIILNSPFVANKLVSMFDHDNAAVVPLPMDVARRCALLARSQCMRFGSFASWMIASESPRVPAIFALANGESRFCVRLGRQNVQESYYCNSGMDAAHGPLHFGSCPLSAGARSRQGQRFFAAKSTP
jgi:hypothetical protein